MTFQTYLLEQLNNWVDGTPDLLPMVKLNVNTNATDENKILVLHYLPTSGSQSRLYFLPSNILATLDEAEFAFRVQPASLDSIGYFQDDHNFIQVAINGKRVIRTFNSVRREHNMELEKWWMQQAACLLSAPSPCASQNTIRMKLNSTGDVSIQYDIAYNSAIAPTTQQRIVIKVKTSTMNPVMTFPVIYVSSALDSSHTRHVAFLTTTDKDNTLQTEQTWTDIADDENMAYPGAVAALSVLGAAGALMTSAALFT